MNSDNPKILVIDPDNSLAQALIHFLPRFAVTVQYANKVKSGLEILQREPPLPLIIIAQTVSDLDCMSTIAVVRKKAPSARLIFIANADDKAAAEEARQHGADLALVQPLALGPLMLHIKKILFTPPTSAPAPSSISAFTPADETARSGVESAPAAAASADSAILPDNIIPCNFPALLEHSVLDISVTGIGLRLSFPLAKNSVLAIRSPELIKKLGVPDDTVFTLRVLHCRELSAGKIYVIGSEFVALPKVLRDKIHSACMNASGFR